MPRHGLIQPTLSISKERIEDMSVWISLDVLVWRNLQKYGYQRLILRENGVFDKSVKSEQKTLPDGDSFVGGIMMLVPDVNVKR